jgi:hypothetical protein
MAATRKRNAEHRHAGKRLPGTVSVPALPLSGAAFCGATNIMHVCGKLCSVKVIGYCLYKTRPIVMGTNKHGRFARSGVRTAVPRSLQPCAP